MFALALWDAAKRQLYLARDRFGIKPLYLARAGASFAFASELRALAAGGFPEERTLDPVEIHHFLAQGWLSPQGSPWRDVRALAPGAVVRIDADGAHDEAPLWTPPPPVDAVDDDAALDALEACLAAASKRQLVADVPVGVFLSGGLDSSTLSALVRRAETGPLRTFSVGFVGPDAVSELPEARRVAEHLGSEHHEIVMEPEEVARDLDTILAGLDAPLADPTAIPTWYMARLARENVTVALSGEGADEIFGGYRRQHLDTRLDGLRAPVRALLPRALRLLGRPVSPRLRARLAMEPGPARMLDWSRLFTRPELGELLAVPLGDEETWVARHEEAAARFAALAERDPLTARLEIDRTGFLPGDLLPKVDRMSMAHSLEVRVPFLDNEVVDLVLPWPGRLKHAARRNKVLLRRLIPRLLPAEVSKRPKRGFEVPIGAWLRSALRPALLERLGGTDHALSALVRPDALSRLLAEHLSAERDHGKALWALLVLEDWARRSGTRPGESPA